MKKLSIALLLTLIIGCSPAIFKSKWTKEIAPKTYIARFETTKGIFDIEVKREWSPKAADRFYQLVKYKYFDDGVFYRVVPEFVAQFGNSDTSATKAWNRLKIPDEKVILGNEKGTLSFARGGKETRTTDLYINLQDNSRLDTLNYNDVVGFPAFGKVIQGMDVVSKIYSGYGGNSAQKTDVLYTNREKYFEEFPKLDLIQKVYFIKN
ncbi:peptidylprolyl isomerase [Maribacter algarum]|uniref:Peptidyl-prolyl cis-trans isomerase n=1 Tax=Maribacter algarum (ex Zhang et al. 2020) TaxID=2578118 RepID=A0A5S3PRM0_9FLAO|nr:peptidylprolyl isomerase [Maribacter algarum]TMM56295.1 peptidylprolyl isomerase [Maribacter algarum]